MKYIVTITIVFSFAFESYSQKLSNSYKSFSEHSKAHIIEFVNDSFVRVSNIRSPMERHYSFVNNYKIRNDTIIIFFNSRILNTDEMKRVNLNYLFDKEIKLIKNNDEYVDLTNRILYVSLKKYYKKKYSNKIIVEFNGKKIVHKTQPTNAYGLVAKPQRKSRYLKQILKNPKAYTSSRLNFIDAYFKYGILGLNGVLIYNKNK